MSGTTTRRTRRAFFLQGSAALGAGVGAAAAASVLVDAKPVLPQEQLGQLRQQFELAEDREAIRRLQLAFMKSIESGNYGAAAELFDDRARLSLSGPSVSGKNAILRFFDQCREQKVTVMHRAYRTSAMQQTDTVVVAEDRARATSTIHVEVELC